MSRKESVYKTRITRALDELTKTQDIRQFAKTMSFIGDVRYEWQAKKVRGLIDELVPVCLSDLPAPDIFPPGVLEEIKDFVRAGRKVSAIKKCYDCSNMGLKESKNFVDNLKI